MASRTDSDNVRYPHPDLGNRVLHHPLQRREPRRELRRLKLVRWTVGLVLLAALALIPAAPSGAAAAGAHLSGGGTADISQVAMNVHIGPSGSAFGSFECLMAGRSGFVLGDFGLQHNMIVHAIPTAGSIAGSVVTFSGSGRLILDGWQKMDIHVRVRVDVAAQSFQLTVVEVGTLPVEQLESGQLNLGS